MTEFISAHAIATACLKYLLGLTRSLRAKTNERFADVEKMCDSTC